MPKKFKPITNVNMTRFWITLEEGARFVIKSFERMFGGEIFVPKIPSMKVTDLARTIAPECRIKIVGIRPGEKLHEVMISEDDARTTIEMSDCYIIQPAFAWRDYNNHTKGKKVKDGFRFSSDTNEQWLSPEQLKEMLKR